MRIDACKSSTLKLSHISNFEPTFALAADFLVFRSSKIMIPGRMAMINGIDHRHSKSTQSFVRVTKKARALTGRGAVRQRTGAARGRGVRFTLHCATLRCEDGRGHELSVRGAPKQGAAPAGAHARMHAVRGQTR